MEVPIFDRKFFFLVSVLQNENSNLRNRETAEEKLRQQYFDKMASIFSGEEDERKDGIIEEIREMWRDPEKRIGWLAFCENFLAEKPEKVFKPSRQEIEAHDYGMYLL